MRIAVWRRPRMSLSGWSRLALAMGFVVIFGSMVLSITESQSVSQIYQRSQALTALADDGDAVQFALLKREVGVDDYIRDPLPSSASLYASGSAETQAALARLQADAKRQGLSAQAAYVASAAQVWESWAQAMKATVDSTGTAITDQQLLNTGETFFQAFQQTTADFQNQADRLARAALQTAGQETDQLATLSIVRAVLAALLLTGLGLLLSRGVIIPVSRLAASARSLAAGRGVTIPGAKRRDEIGDLSRALTSWHKSRTERERLFDLSPDLFSIAAHGYFTVLNGAWETVTGFRRVELMAEPYLRFCHPEEVAEVKQHFEQFGKGGSSLAFRSRFLCKDGSYRWLDWKISPGVDEGMGYGVARDITEQVSVEETLRQAGEQIRSILDNVADGIVTIDESGRLQSANPLVESMFGYASRDLVGQPVSVLIAQPDQADFLRHLQSYLRPDKKRVRSGSHETIGRRKDGTTFPMEFIGTQTESGNQRIFIGTLRDITEQKQEREDLQQRLLYDSLTNLPTRAVFMERLREEITVSQRDATRWGLVILDLDRFKEVNDSLGHDEGDRLLVAVAQRLSGSLSSASRMARMGGDEFAIWSTKISDGESASQRTAQILASLEEPFRIGNRNIDVRASAGIAIFPDHGKDLDALMRHADVAMYLAKRRQAGFMIYSPEADDGAGARLGLRGEVRHAIAHNEFFLDYMPIIELKGGGLESVEALTRWQHPERGLIPPVEFIPAVEQTELIHPLTRWVLEQAMGQLHAWRNRHLPAAVSVNLSSLNLEDESLAGWLESLLTRLAIDPSAVILEITETSAMAPKASAVMHGLNELGVRISIDDFGTGYSSLAYLQRLPVDLIKIDRSFVSEMVTNPGAASIVRSVVDLAHNLRLEAVAEGVENERTQEMLRSLGCDYAQGYYISRPLSVETATRWISTRTARAA